MWPAAVGQLVRLVPRLGDTRLDVGQWRGELRHFDGISFGCIGRYCYSYRQKKGCQRMPRGIKKQKNRISTGLEAGFCTSLDCLKHVLGIGGLEYSAQTRMDERSAVFENLKYRH
jgi:hypothetical protein